jgi:hypothetical protein
MTPRQFYQLDEMEQAEVMWNAVHIGERKDSEYRYELLQLASLYLEVKYSIEHNVRRGISAFEYDQISDLYLEAIDIRVQLN